MLGDAKERGKTVGRGSGNQDPDPHDDHVFGNRADCGDACGTQYDKWDVRLGKVEITEKVFDTRLLFGRNTKERRGKYGTAETVLRGRRRNGCY